MHVHTARFGPIPISPDDVFYFPFGLIGWEDRRHWVLLADTQNEALAWLQSTTDPDLALAVVSPRRFAPHYRIRVPQRELSAIELDDVGQAYVLNIVAKNNGLLTVNLRAPLVFNLERRLGRQVVTSEEQPVQWGLSVTPMELRKSA